MGTQTHTRCCIITVLAAVNTRILSEGENVRLFDRQNVQCFVIEPMSPGEKVVLQPVGIMHDIYKYI